MLEGVPTHSPWPPLWAEISPEGGLESGPATLSRYESAAVRGASGPPSTIVKGLQDQHLLELFLKRKMMRLLGPILLKGDMWTQDSWDLSQIQAAKTSRQEVRCWPAQTPG